MHLKDLLGSFVRVGYRIPVPDFYLVLHGLRCRKSTIMNLTNQINETATTVIDLTVGCSEPALTGWGSARTRVKTYLDTEGSSYLQVVPSSRLWEDLVINHDDWVFLVNLFYFISVGKNNTIKSNNIKCKQNDTLYNFIIKDCGKQNDTLFNSNNSVSRYVLTRARADPHPFQWNLCLLRLYSDVNPCETGVPL